MTPRIFPINHQNIPDFLNGHFVDRRQNNWALKLFQEFTE